MHQMKSLRDFFQTSIETNLDLSLPSIYHTTTKERQIQAKRKKMCTKNFARKRCPNSTLNCSPKTLKICDCFFSNEQKTANYCERKQKPTTMG